MQWILAFSGIQALYIQETRRMVKSRRQEERWSLLLFASLCLKPFYALAKSTRKKKKNIYSCISVLHCNHQAKRKNFKTFQKYDMPKWLPSLDNHTCSQTILTLSYLSKRKTRLFMQEVIYSATKLLKATAPAGKHEKWKCCKRDKKKILPEETMAEKCLFLKRNRQKQTKSKRGGPKCQSSAVSLNNSNRTGTSLSLEPSAYTINNAHVDSNVNSLEAPALEGYDQCHWAEKTVLQGEPGHLEVKAQQASPCTRHPLESLAQTGQKGGQPPLATVRRFRGGRKPKTSSCSAILTATAGALKSIISEWSLT